MKVLSILFLSFLLSLFHTQSGRASAPELIPQLSGKDLTTGKHVQLDLRALTSPSVVVFLSTKCPCSGAHLPALKELSLRFKAFQFIGIHSNTDEDEATSESFFSKAALPFPVIQDKNADLAKRFLALKTPHTFVISPKGELLFQGGIDNSHSPEKASRHFLEEVLTALSKGEKPPLNEARTLGCAIRRS